jgi:hypothetical protein
VLPATVDGPELYLAVEVSVDYAELLRRAVSKQFLVEGRGVEPLTPTLRTSCSPN